MNARMCVSSAIHELVDRNLLLDRRHLQAARVLLALLAARWHTIVACAAIVAIVNVAAVASTARQAAVAVGRIRWNTRDTLWRNQVALAPQRASDQIEAGDHHCVGIEPELRVSP